MTDLIERILIGYGSESGNARALALRLGEQPFLQPFAPQVIELNQLIQAEPRRGDLLLIVSSSFGDGEPPANAEQFAEAIEHYAAIDGLRYAIFGLGDTAYPRFCGFTKQLDEVLTRRGARPVINRVDADASFDSFFTLWLPVLEKVLAGDEQAGRDLCLQVTAWGEDNAFAAPIVERRLLSARAPYAWHVRLNIAGSGIHYRAGDTLYLQPENDEQLLSALAAWLGRTDAVEALRHRELRQIGKSLLRDLAKLSGSDTLKGMLKISQRKVLEEYLYGADLLDVLEEFCTPESVTLEALLERVPACLPRAYSIASCPDTEIVDLCVREVIYTRRGRQRSGTATGWLLNTSAPVRVFSRANPGFWLPKAPDAPMLLIGTGTGIAPLIGLLREQATQAGPQRETCLIFGEKHRKEDFLYRTELEARVENGTPGTLFTAFSRDGDRKYYVQDAIAEHGEYLSSLLRRGAHVYLCGNKQHLERAVQDALTAVYSAEESDPVQAESLWAMLAEQGRLHLELY